MDMVIATGSALGRIQYPNQSAMSSIQPISILADHEHQHYKIRNRNQRKSFLLCHFLHTPIPIDRKLNMHLLYTIHQFLSIRLQHRGWQRLVEEWQELGRLVK